MARAALTSLIYKSGNATTVIWHCAFSVKTLFIYSANVYNECKLVYEAYPKSPNASLRPQLHEIDVEL